METPELVAEYWATVDKEYPDSSKEALDRCHVAYKTAIAAAPRKENDVVAMGKTRSGKPQYWRVTHVTCDRQDYRYQYQKVPS